MKKMFRSVLAMLLCCMMVCSPLAASAEGIDGNAEEELVVTVEIKENDTSSETVETTVEKVIDGENTPVAVETEVVLEAGEFTVTEGEGNGEMVDIGEGIAPEEYEGKQEVFDECYAGSETPKKDVFQGGGLGYENMWDMAQSFDYIVKEVDENGNETGRYVLDAEKMKESMYGSSYIEGSNPEYALIASGERGYSSMYIKEVEYELDENGQVKTDEEGNPIYSLSKGEKQHAAQMVLFGTDGKVYYAYSVASDKEALVTSMITGYEAEELSKSDLYKDKPEVQAHIRGIALHGYWGTSNEADENGEYKTGSLEKLKAEMKAAVEGGLELEIAGSNDKEAVLAAIDALSEGDAVTATQAAFWAYSQGTEDSIDGKVSQIVTGEFDADAAGHVSLIYQYLLGVTDVESDELIGVDKDSMSLSVGEKLGEVTEGGETNGIYSAALNFSLTLIPGEKDELNVVLQYVDADGNNQTVIRALGKENSENTIAPNADGSYTMSGLKLSENQDITFDLKLEGTQYLKDGVYVYTATHVNDGYVSEYFGDEGARHSTLVGVGEVGKNVDVSTSITLRFDVNENEEVLVIPGEPANPEETEVEVEEVVPLALEAEEEVEIAEEEVPLAAAPQTGSKMMIAAVLAVISAACLIVLILDSKKRKEN